MPKRVALHAPKLRPQTQSALSAERCTPNYATPPNSIRAECCSPPNSILRVVVLVGLLGIGILGLGIGLIGLLLGLLGLLLHLAWRRQL